jgi:TRAP-type mannitol/chloroaromatic compound transport system permease small subunit
MMSNGRGRRSALASGTTVAFPVRVLVRSIETISRLSGYAAAVLVLTLMLLMVYEVVVRYVFAAPTVWGYEVSTWVMGASFVLAIGYALMTDSHVRIDFLHDWLGKRARHVFDLLGYAIVLPLLVWLSWKMWNYFYAPLLSGERTGQSAWNPRVWPFRLILFIGILTWTLQVIAEVVKSLLWLAGRQIEEPEKHEPLE